jgi:hypothetical protein
MARRLTFKSPCKVKTILLIFAVAFILSPGVRNITSNTLHTVADVIRPYD